MGHAPHAESLQAAVVGLQALAGLARLAGLPGLGGSSLARQAVGVQPAPELLELLLVHEPLALQGRALLLLVLPLQGLEDGLHGVWSTQGRGGGVNPQTKGSVMVPRQYNALTMQALRHGREPVSVLRRVLVSGPITALAAASPRRKVTIAADART